MSMSPTCFTTPLCTFHPLPPPLHHINIPSPCPLLSFLLLVYFAFSFVCLPQNAGHTAMDYAKTEVSVISLTLVPLDMSPSVLVLTFFILGYTGVNLSVYLFICSV